MQFMRRMTSGRSFHVALFVVYTFQVLGKLSHAARADEHRRHALLLKNPFQGSACKSLSPALCLVVEPAQTVEQFGGERVFREILATRLSAGIPLR